MNDFGIPTAVLISQMRQWKKINLRLTQELLEGAEQLLIKRGYSKDAINALLKTPKNDEGPTEGPEGPDNVPSGPSVGLLWPDNVPSGPSVGLLWPDNVPSRAPMGPARVLEGPWKARQEP